MVGLDHKPPDSAEFDNAETTARNRRLGLVLFAIYLAIYSAFVLLNAFRPDLVEIEIGLLGGVNVAVAFGMGLIATAFLLAILYGWLCRSPVAASTDSQEAGR